MRYYTPRSTPPRASAGVGIGVRARVGAGRWHRRPSLGSLSNKPQPRPHLPHHTQGRGGGAARGGGGGPADRAQDPARPQLPRRPRPPDAAQGAAAAEGGDPRGQVGQAQLGVPEGGAGLPLHPAPAGPAAQALRRRLGELPRDFDPPRPHLCLARPGRDGGRPGPLLCPPRRGGFPGGGEADRREPGRGGADRGDQAAAHPARYHPAHETVGRGSPRERIGACAADRHAAMPSCRRHVPPPPPSLRPTLSPPPRPLHSTPLHSTHISPSPTHSISLSISLSLSPSLSHTRACTLSSLSSVSR